MDTLTCGFFFFGFIPRMFGNLQERMCQSQMSEESGKAHDRSNNRWVCQDGQME